MVVSYYCLEINLSLLRRLNIVFLKKSVSVLLLSFLKLVFLTIVAMKFFYARNRKSVISILVANGFRHRQEFIC